jgi:diguanylate cyclase (GGDEF)-like protein
MDRNLHSPPRFLSALFGALAFADPALDRHSTAVAELAARVAAQLELSRSECADVRAAAALHDIGKLALPDSILQKPAALDEDEWTLMRMHPVVGERLLNADPSLAGAAAMVRASHERFDGGGYPDGVAGEAIPLGARIVAVCDAYHAMVAERPYRAALCEADALAELRRCAGTQFDPTVVDAFARELETPTVLQPIPAPPVERLWALDRIRRLDGLLEAASALRSEEHLPEVLDRIAATLCETLGFGVAVFNLYRPAWDDFVASTIYGPEDVREALLGSTYAWDMFEPLLDERFLRRGAYVIRHGDFDWSQDKGNRYIPDLPVHDNLEAWHPEDEIFVPIRHTDGTLLGIVNVGQPLSGLRPSDEELDALIVVAKHAARAVQGAQEAAVAAGHRRALEQLLQVSSRLTDTHSIESILGAVSEGIEQALGFTKVVVQLLDPSAGALRPAAATGFELDDPSLQIGWGEEELDRLLVPERELEGCYLLSLEAVSARVTVPAGAYRSLLNGRGPHAWDRHWLLVPLHDRTGALIGVIMPDEPSDRLLPTRERLQALRLFANQTATAFESLRHFEDVRSLAERDPLTRLFNRRAFLHRLEEETARCERAGSPLALVFCDLNGFKQINDTNGHEAGDDALIRFASILAESIRTDDQAFRLGGDEFAVVAPGCSRHEALSIIERVCAALAGDSESGSTPLSASFGVAVTEPGARRPVQSLLRRADRQMYEAKRSGLTVRAA